MQKPKKALKGFIEQEVYETMEQTVDEKSDIIFVIGKINKLSQISDHQLVSMKSTSVCPTNCRTENLRKQRGKQIVRRNSLRAWSL